MIANRIPDFIIAGAPRSGTTWLYKMLDSHSEVYMASPVSPEPKFFLVDYLFNKGIDYYSSTWFSNIDDSIICGEKSTNYMENEYVALRIFKSLPDVKLIFILREPVARAFSNYKWSCMHGLETEPFEKAIQIETCREQEYKMSHRFSRPFSYFSRGLYYQHLLPYFNLFKRNQILVTRFEDIIEQPKELTKKICNFLQISIEESFFNFGVVNPSKKENLILPKPLQTKLEQAYLIPNSQLKTLLDNDFKIWHY